MAVMFIPPAFFATRGGLEPWCSSSGISLDCLLPHKDRARRLQQTPVVPPRLLPSPCAVLETSPPHPLHPLKSSAPPRNPSSLQAMQHRNNTFPSFIPSHVQTPRTGPTTFHSTAGPGQQRARCAKVTAEPSPSEVHDFPRSTSAVEGKLCQWTALRAADGTVSRFNPS